MVGRIMSMPPDEELPPARLSRRTAQIGSAQAETRALGVFAIVALAAMIWIIRPVGIGILLGTLSAFSLQSFYEHLKERTGRPTVAAALCVTVSTLGFIGIMGGLSSLFITRGSVIAQS